MQLVTDQVGHVPGVEVTDAGSLLAEDFAHEVVGRGWHVVLLKSLISALALYISYPLGPFGCDAWCSQERNCMAIECLSGNVCSERPSSSTHGPLSGTARSTAKKNAP